MNKVTVQCACGARYAMEPQATARTARCGKCQAAIVIPAAPAGPAAAPAQAPAAASGAAVPRRQLTCACGKVLTVPDKPGLVGRCPQCGAEVEVPVATPSGPIVFTYKCMSCDGEVRSDADICPACGWDEDQKRRSCMHCRGRINIVYRPVLQWCTHLVSLLVLAGGLFLYGLLRGVMAALLVEGLFRLWRAVSVRFACEECGAPVDLEILKQREHARTTHHRRTHGIQTAAAMGGALLVFGLQSVLPPVWSGTIGEWFATPEPVKEERPAPRPPEPLTARAKKAIQDLASPDAAMRRAAARSLVEIGRTSEPLPPDQCAEAVRALSGRLASDDAGTRFELVRALGAFGLRTPGAGEVLVGLLGAAEFEAPLLDAVFQAIVEARADGSIGPDHASAIPALLRALPDDPSRADARGRAALQALRRIGRPAIAPLVAMAKDGLPVERRRALPALVATAGEDATVVVSVLLDAHEDEMVRSTAEGLLSSLPVSRAWAHCLRDLALDPGRDAPARRRAIESLIARRDEAADQVDPCLAELARRGDPETSRRAMSALQRFGALDQFGAEDDAALPILLEAARRIDSPHTESAQSILTALGRFGERAVAAICEMTRDADPAVRFAGIVVLGELGSVDPATAVATFAAATLDPDPRVAGRADAYLAGVPPGEAAAAALRAAAASPDVRLRNRATDLLLNQLGGCEFVLPHLLDILNESDPPTQRRIFLSLLAAGRAGEVRQGHEKAIPGLLLAVHPRSRAPDTILDALGQPVPSEAEIRSSRESEAALAAITRMGRRALSTLTRLLRSDDPDVRRAAMRAIESQGEAAVDPLTGCLSDRETRLDAIESLQAIGIPAVKGIIEGLRSDDPSLRGRAEQAFDVVVGPGAEGAVSSLVAALNDRREYIRLKMIDGLISIGPGAKRALPNLRVRATTDKSDVVKERAQLAIDTIGSKN